MRRFVRSAPVAAVLACLLPCISAAAQGPAPLEGAWESETVHLGDPVTLTVEVPVDRDPFYIKGLPPAGAAWGTGTVVRVRQTPPESFPGALRLVFTLQVFDTGEVALPPFPLGVDTDSGETVYSLSPPPLALTPLLPEDAEAPPPPAPLLPLPSGTPWKVWVLAALFLAAAAAFMALLYRRSMAAGPGPLPERIQEVDPDRWIREEVDRLFLGEAGAYKLYGLLSRRLREYLRTKTSHPFPDWTTAEIRTKSRRLSLFEDGAIALLGDSLSFCDQVSFARHQPTPTERDATREKVLRFLDDMLRSENTEEAS